MKQFPTHIVAVDGFIENEKNEILLVKNSYRGIYTVPGGQVETGENLMDALKREIQEESGVEVEVGKLICVSSNTCTYQGYNGYGLVPTKVMFSFICKYLSGTLQTSDETSETIWVKKEDLSKYIDAPYMVKRLDAYLNYKGEVQYLEYITKPEFEIKLERLI